MLGVMGEVSTADPLRRELVAALGVDRVRTDPLDLALFAKDASMLSGEAGLVCFPRSTSEVAAAVRAANRHGRPFVARGAGTGLAGGAVPLDGPVVIVTTHMDRVLEVDPDERVAWVEPGVRNLDLSRHVARWGLRFSPDPSSQQASSVGGNVSTNAGGPHCLRDGVTTAHVLAVEVVLPDGEITVLGGLDPDPAGYDLRGLFVGGEGTLGIATRIAVRLVPQPEAVATLLAAFPTTTSAAEAVSAIIAAGVLPAAVEMMDAPITAAVEAHVHAGLPLDAAAIVLVEVDGPPHRVRHEAGMTARLARQAGATSVEEAADAEQRAAWWTARKSAFGAIARIQPDYYLHDTVVPRTRLVEVLDGVYEIAARLQLDVVNVFHAGDGNLHPLLLFDRQEPGVMERVQQAGEEIVRLSLDAGGVLTGEHGIGLEKRDFMSWMFSDADLDAQDRVRRAFDPDGVANPAKVLPSGAGCGDIGQAAASGLWV